ncbi:ComEC/Rec2 family competence protein [Cystobacter fuscus]
MGRRLGLAGAALAHPLLRPRAPGHGGAALVRHRRLAALWRGARVLGPGRAALAPRRTPRAREPGARPAAAPRPSRAGPAHHLPLRGSGRRDGAQLRGTPRAARWRRCARRRGSRVRVVVPFLRASSIERLDLAVLSHPHPDHALGLISALRQVPTERLWLPADSADGPLSRQLISAAAGAHVEEVQRGHAPYLLGEATLEVLGPPEDRLLLEGQNDTSVVLLVRHGDVTVLLPGDVEEAGEEALLAEGALGPVTVLKAPHHGSRTSSTEGLLARLRPRFAIFCVGRRNRFGFPHPEVEERYRALGTECLRTDLHGAITLESDGHDVRLNPFLPASTRNEDVVAPALSHHQP